MLYKINSKRIRTEDRLHKISKSRAIKYRFYSISYIEGQSLFKVRLQIEDQVENQVEEQIENQIRYKISIRAREKLFNKYVK